MKRNRNASRESIFSQHGTRFIHEDFAKVSHASQAYQKWRIELAMLCLLTFVLRVGSWDYRAVSQLYCDRPTAAIALGPGNSLTPASAPAPAPASAPTPSRAAHSMSFCSVLSVSFFCISRYYTVTVVPLQQQSQQYSFLLSKPLCCCSAVCYRYYRIYATAVRYG